MGRESVRGHARERLLSAGADLFLERGIHAVSVDALADEAGVTKRTVYQHFPGKDTLVAQALEQRGMVWRSWFDAELDRRGATPEQQLLAMFDVVAEEISAGGYRGCRFVNAAAELPDPAHPARAVASAHKVAVLALIARRAAQLGTSQPDLLARQLKVLLEGAITTALIDPSPQAARDARLAAEALLAHALASQAQPQGRGGRHEDTNTKITRKETAVPGFTELHTQNAEVAEIAPGLVVRRLWRSGPERTARRALAVDFEPGAAWPGVDEHEPGPEEVFVVSGTFTGLTGPGSRHDAGTFIHCDAGTSHSPSTATGGRLFVYYPEG